MSVDESGIESMGLNTSFDADQSEWLTRLSRVEATLADMPEGFGVEASGTGYADLLLEKGRALVALERGDEGWAPARQAMDVFLANQEWEKAVDTCDVLFRAEQDGSLSALGQGIWLAVTFPVDLELALTMLHHVIDETPDDSDGAAVAAAVGVYITDLRAEEGQRRENLLFFSNQMLGKVARRHSNVESQQEFGAWVIRLELDDPEKFLIRLRNVVDVLVQEDWWFDRDALRAALPQD